MSPTPILVVDFEASCLGDFSYPIEAGIARWDGLGSPIRAWSSLIVPQRRWTDHGDWTSEAQKIHGITPADLENGRSPHDVISGLRMMAAGMDRAMCDGGEHDLRWLVRLTMASSWPHLPFGLVDFGQAIERLDEDVGTAVHDALMVMPTPHRAAPDAVRLLQAYVIGTTGSPVDVVTVQDRDVLPDS